VTVKRRLQDAQNTDTLALPDPGGHGRHHQHGLELAGRFATTISKCSEPFVLSAAPR